MDRTKAFKLLLALFISISFPSFVVAKKAPRPVDQLLVLENLATDSSTFQEQRDLLISQVDPPILRIQFTFGPTADPHTFKVKLDRQEITDRFMIGPEGAAATITTTFGRHRLHAEIQGTIQGKKKAQLRRDRDRFVFSIQIVSGTGSPTVSISSPKDGETISTSPIAVTGTITKSDAVVSSSISLNNGPPAPLPFLGDGSFSHDVQLVPGANTIQVAIVDSQGNTSQASVSITFSPPVTDTTPPDILIRSPADNSIISGTSILLQGQVTDDSGAPTVEILVSGGPGPIPTLGIDGTFTQEVAILGGPNTIQVRATDVARNVKEESVTVSRDTAFVTQFVTAAAGSTLTFPATGMTVTIPPNALSTDALVTLRFPAQPTTPPTVESGAVFASQRTEILLEPVVSSQDGYPGGSRLAAAKESGELVLSDAIMLAQTTPPPPSLTFIGPITITIPYDPAKVIEGTEFPFVWDGTQYRLPADAIKRTLDRVQGILTATLDVTEVKVAAAEAVFAVIGVLAGEQINLGTTLTMAADQGPSIDRNALPVILVPGLFGDPSSLTNIRTQLTNTGVYRPLPVTSFPGLRNGVLTNAGLLGSEFSRVRSTILNNFIPTSINLPVDVMGYSAGAVPSRQFISNLLGVNPAGVGSLTQIGPPNHGSILVKNREAAEEVVRTQIPATVRLLPGMVQAAAEGSTWAFFTLEEAGRFPGASDLAPNTPVLNALNQSLPFSTLNRQFVIAGTRSLSDNLDLLFRELGLGVNDGLVSFNSASLDGQGGPSGSITPFAFDHLRLPREPATVAEVPKHLSDWYVVTDVAPGTITLGQATTLTITIKHNFNRQARTLVAALFDANATRVVSGSRSIPNTGLNTTQMTLDITATTIPASAPRPISLVVASDADLASITTADLSTQTPADAKMNMVRVGQTSRLGIFQRVVAGERMLVAIGFQSGATFGCSLLGVEPEVMMLKFKNVRDLIVFYQGLNAEFEAIPGLEKQIVFNGSQAEFQNVMLQLDTLVSPDGRQAVNHNIGVFVEQIDAGGFICVKSISGLGGDIATGSGLCALSSAFAVRECPE